MTSAEKSTREIILKVATELFAQDGYNGTSVREIAKKADVNLAAINYHFTNKEKLYFEVFNQSWQSMNDDIHQLGEDPSIDTREFTWRVFDYFFNNGSSLMNTFRIGLSEKLSCSEDLPCFSEDEIRVGPPGKEMLFNKITADVGEEIPFEGRHWAMRNIFACIAQHGLVVNFPFMRDNIDKLPFFGAEDRKKSVYFLVDAILNYLKDNPNSWK